VPSSALSAGGSGNSVVSLCPPFPVGLDSSQRRRGGFVGDNPGGTEHDKGKDICRMEPMEEGGRRMIFGETDEETLPLRREDLMQLTDTKETNDEKAIRKRVVEAFGELGGLQGTRFWTAPGTQGGSFKKASLKGKTARMAV